MCLFFEKGLRSGFSCTAKRYAKTNNKYISNYDPAKQSLQIPYLEMNNLYGYGMSNYLPYGRFKWLKNVDKFGVNCEKNSEKSPIGHILEIEIDYPDEIHVLYHAYPFTLETFANHYDMQSDYCTKIEEKYGIKVVDVITLIPNLDDKTNYYFITEIFSCHFLQE